MLIDFFKSNLTIPYFLLFVKKQKVEPDKNLTLPYIQQISPCLNGTSPV
nr:MAG TPA: hypothetical protein [Caudoviricetes sp.]